MAELPALFDRADGLGGRDGIATPTGVILVNDNGTLSDWGDAPALKLREICTSPEIERAEQATITKTFIMSWEEGMTRIQSLGRGTLMVDSSGEVTRVLAARLNRERPGFAVLTVVSEGLSFDTPPDEFSVEPVELGVHIIKHPRYYSALNPASADYTNYIAVGDLNVPLSDIKQSIIRAIQAYMDAPIFPSENNINGYFQTSVMSQVADGGGIDFNVANPAFDPTKKENTPVKWSGATADIANLPNGNFRSFVVTVPKAKVLSTPGVRLAQAAAREIIEKIWRQEEQPYVVGYQMTLTSYWFRPPVICPGGIIDDPILGGSIDVPDYFISDTYPPDRNYTIFDYLPAYNPTCYSASGLKLGGRGRYNVDYSISWLRKSDQLIYERTWFKLIRTWIGAPLGVWDQQLYSYASRPSKPSDYVTSFVSLNNTT